MLLKPQFSEEWIATPTQIGFGAGQLSFYNYDLRDGFGAWISLRFGRNYGGTPSAGLRFSAFPFPTSLGEGYVSHAGAMITRTANRSAGANDVAGVSLTNAGATSIEVTSGGFVAGDRICIFGPSGERVEWKRVTRVDGTTLYTDTPFLYAHDPATSDIVVSGADIFAPFWLPGGHYYNFAIDNQNENTLGYWFAIQSVRHYALKTFPG